MKAILVAVDLSQHSACLLARAAQLANHGKAVVTVLHVRENLSYEEEILRGAVEKQVRATLEASIAAAGFDNPPALLVEDGVPHRVITETTRELSADVIVIGPGQPASVAEYMFGSTADRVVRTAPAPILIVRNETAQPYRYAAVAIDFSPFSQAALDATRTLAPAAERVLVHACEIPLQFEQAMLKVGTPATEVERYRQSRLAKSRSQLVKFARRYGSREKTLLLRGMPAEALIDLSRDDQVDLIALGSQGLNAVTQALIGSVAMRLLAQAGCDLLVVGAASATQ